MKQYIEVIKDSFTDYAGKEHHFVIAAVSELLGGEGSTPIVISTEGLNTSILGPVEKGIRLGVAICNPEDKFDEKVGVLKATARAKNAGVSLYATDRGQINTGLIKAFLEQEASYLKNNPEKYIKGYAESKQRFLKKQEMLALKESFSDVEKAVVAGVEDNPKFLENAQKYIAWANNQKKGKCKKHGK